MYSMLHLPQSYMHIFVCLVMKPHRQWKAQIALRAKQPRLPHLHLYMLRAQERDRTVTSLFHSMAYSTSLRHTLNSLNPGSRCDTSLKYSK